MFYKLSDGHSLPHDPIKAIVAPRPIAWVATRGELSDNLAPFSFFAPVSNTPFMVGFNIGQDPRGGIKDTLDNIRARGEYSISIPSSAHLEQVVNSGVATPKGMDEFSYADIIKGECELIKAPRVLDAPASLECCLEQILPLRGGAHWVIGEVVAVHIDDARIENGLFNSKGLLARLGYFDYTQIESSQSKPTPQYQKP